MVIDYNPPQSNLTTSYIWHQRLGHPSNKVLKTLGLPPLNDPCHTCMSGKSMLLPFSGQFDKVNQLLECVHLDLVGPISPPSVAGYKYFLTIVNQFSSFKTVRFLKTKENCYNEFVNWKTFAENLHEKKIKRVISDKGGEFENKSFKMLALKCGFTHDRSPTATP
ncbi:hypothetical protein O181_051518 [Austropuccinia psidii MF-1]|uniref:Integrase catalytic domain-containing protein n=1 Tax=Austropuccinia psidii MF-1 TaxID=1389203 RepID=A0A9Q3E129_9BASI|nr:hypothetical protein [Austropuccinia psidii MF-1]